MATITVGFTGTRKGMSDLQKERLETLLWALTSCGAQVELHHGDCIGADEEADSIAQKCHAIIHIHPPRIASNRAYCPGDVMYAEKSYLARNKDIVDACSLLVAAPYSNQEELRSGTWSTIRYARKTGKQVFMLSR